MYMKVNVAMFRRSMSHYLDKVREGHTVILADRGRPVAQLMAPTQASELLTMHPPRDGFAGIAAIVSPLRLPQATPSLRDNVALQALRDERRERC